MVRGSSSSPQKRTSDARRTLTEQIAPLQARLAAAQSNERRMVAEQQVLQDELGACEAEPSAMLHQLRQVVESEKLLVDEVDAMREQAAQMMARLAVAEEESSRLVAERAAVEIRTEEAERRAAKRDVEIHLEKTVQSKLSEQLVATIEKLHPLELLHAEGLATVAKLTEQKAQAEAGMAKAGQELERIRISAKALFCIYLREVRLAKRQHKECSTKLTQQKAAYEAASKQCYIVEHQLGAMRQASRIAAEEANGTIEKLDADLAVQRTLGGTLQENLVTERTCYEQLARLLMLSQARLRSYEVAFGTIATAPSAHPPGSKLLIRLDPADYARCSAPNRVKMLAKLEQELDALYEPWLEKIRTDPAKEASTPASTRGLPVPPNVPLPLQPLHPSADAKSPDAKSPDAKFADVLLSLRPPATMAFRPATQPELPVVPPSAVLPPPRGASLEQMADMRPQHAPPEDCLHLTAGRRLLPRMDNHAGPAQLVDLLMLQPPNTVATVPASLVAPSARMATPYESRAEISVSPAPPSARRGFTPSTTSPLKSNRLAMLSPRGASLLT